MTHASTFTNFFNILYDPDQSFAKVDPESYLILEFSLQNLIQRQIQLLAVPLWPCYVFACSLFALEELTALAIPPATPPAAPKALAIIGINVNSGIKPPVFSICFN